MVSAVLASLLIQSNICIYDQGLGVLSHWPSARMHSEGYGTWSVSIYVYISVCFSVCYHVFCHYVQLDNRRAKPIGSALHWLDFIFGDFQKSTAFELWRENLVKKHQLAQAASARSVYLERTRSRNEGRVSTPACYLLLYLARVLLCARY